MYTLTNTHSRSLYRRQSIKVAFSLAHVHALHPRRARARAHAGIDVRLEIRIARCECRACGSSIHKLATDRATNYSGRTCFKSWTVTTDLRERPGQKESRELWVYDLLSQSGTDHRRMVHSSNRPFVFQHSDHACEYTGGYNRYVCMGVYVCKVLI